MWGASDQPRYPVSEWVRTTEPTITQEPLTLTEAKKQVGIAADVDYHDERLRDFIAAARRQFEGDTGIVCYTGEFTGKITDWPCELWIPLQLRPVTAIGSITYVDFSGTTQTWSSSNYSLEASGVVPFIKLAYLQFWPIGRLDVNSITITLTAGYSAVTAVPRDAKAAIAMQLSYLWAVSNGEATAEAFQKAYDRLIVGGLMRSSYP